MQVPSKPAAPSAASGIVFQPLAGWEDTRDTLHWYARAVCVLPRALAIPHPKWWHISLKVQPDGLVTDSFPLPGGGICALVMDLLEGSPLEQYIAARAPMPVPREASQAASPIASAVA